MEINYNKGYSHKNKKQVVKTQKADIQKIYINPRLLNINTILKKHNPKTHKNIQTYETNNSSNNTSNNIINLNSDITIVNNILNNNNKNKNSKNNKYNKFNIVKYLGEGIQGSLYLANDSKKKRYICKKITLDTNQSNQTNQLKQIELELNILTYLSRNNITKEYINPCVEHKIIDNNIFTIFPVFDGYSLNHLTKYLGKLDNDNYYEIIFHLIKTILHGMAKIHQFKVAHQNINDNSILVSTYTNPKEIYVNFTDFGLGCGNSNMHDSGTMDNIGNMVNISDYERQHANNIKFNTCKVNNFAPVKITDEIMPDLIDSDYLLISQKYDLLCLGLMFIKLLLFFDNINVDLKKGYNNSVMENILTLLNDKYLSN